MDKKLLTKMVQTAVDAGSPRDQVETFIKAKHVAFPWQWEFHALARQADLPDGPVDIGLGGARGPGKSHAVLAQAAIDDCQRVSGLKCLFLRQTGKAAQESFDDLILKVLAGRVHYERTSSMLKFTNGSRMILGGFKTSSDIDKYIGIEYDLMIVEELNQITEDKYIKLRGSLRTSKENWRPRIYTSFNPGGIGHTFVRDRYVYQPEKLKKEVKFVGSTYKSNPTLNKEYIEYLEGLEGALGRAWREGDFDIFEGQVFPELKHLTHVIKPIIPDKDYQHYMWIDWGYADTHPTTFTALMTAVIDKTTFDGQKYKQLITYREWCGNKKEPQEWARIIYKDLKQMGIKPAFAVSDPAMHSPLQSGSASIAKLMREEWDRLNGEHWITIKAGSNSGRNSRVNRVGMMHAWMSINPMTELPYWMVTENCTNIMRTVPSLIYDENLPEAYDTAQEDHVADAIAYGLEKIKFQGVKAGAVPYKTGQQKKQITFTEDGQKPFTSDDFANQYKQNTNGIITIT